MPRKAPEIKLSDAEKAHLEKLSRSHSAERRMVERATILLACAEGKQNQQIANELGVSTVRVGKWRSRFALQGLSGLNDEPRPGKPVIHDAAFRNKLLAQLEKTPPLFAALNVATGEIKGQTTQTKTRDDFRQFMAAIIEDEPPHREIHVILDNYCTHKRNEDWLAACGRPVYFHYTPTSASWLNQIEIWFGILLRKALKQASFTSTEDLKNAIAAFIKRHNERAQPFKWRRREVKGAQIKNTITNLRN